jgi:hypothetical protein
LDEPKVVDVMLVVADQQSSALRQPGKGSFHDPSTSLPASWPTRLSAVLTDWPNVRYIAMPLSDFMAGRVVVPLVQTKVLLATLRVGTFDYDRLDRGLEQLLVHDIGSGDHYAKWSSIPLDQDRLLGSVLGAIRGVFPHVFPAESRFAQATICRLPASIDASELVAFRQQDGPNLLEDAVAAPPLEPAMDRAIVTEMLGKLVPLASGAKAEDGTVEGRSPVNSRATAMSLGPCRSILPQDRLNPLPELVVDFPDCIEG